MKEPANRFHSEVIGSLLRPGYLQEAAKQHQEGASSLSQLEAVQERAIAEALALQEAVGVDIVTDGEMRRRSWTDPLTRSVSGYGPAQMPSGYRVNWHRDGEIEADPGARPQGAQTALTTAVIARVGRGAENLPLREMEFLKARTNKPFKVTLPSLAHASVFWAPGVSDKVYADKSAYMAEVLEVVSQVVGECVAAGATYVQLDSPRYTHLVSEEGRDNLRQLGIDPQSWLREMIALDNGLIDRFPGVTWGLHLCRGNGAGGAWSVAGGYDPIAEELFNQIHVDRLLLEYDSPRAGTFAPLRFVPGNKCAVLGLISTKAVAVETAAELHRRIEEAAEYIPLDRLSLSPQCGFASAFQGAVTEDIQRAKLDALVHVAHEVWG